MIGVVFLCGLLLWFFNKLWGTFGLPWVSQGIFGGPWRSLGGPLLPFLLLFGVSRGLSRVLGRFHGGPWVGAKWDRTDTRFSRIAWGGTLLFWLSGRVLTTDPGNANVYISIVSAMCLQVSCFLCLFGEFLMWLFLRIVDFSNGFGMSTCLHFIGFKSYLWNAFSLTATSSHNFFDLFRRSIEFQGLRRVDLA